MKRLPIILLLLPLGSSCSTQRSKLDSGVRLPQGTAEAKMPDAAQFKREADAEESKQARLNLNLALKQAASESKSFDEFDQRLTAISQLLQYQRIEEGGRIDRHFEKRAFELKHASGLPWDMEKARIELNMARIEEVAAFQKRIAIEDAQIELERKMAKLKTQ